MKPKPTIHEHYEQLSQLHQLPRKILLLHGTENMPEFVLHELCHEKCFNVHKAAYFVDNPDFDCLKGVAGINRDEVVGAEDIWAHPDHFAEVMKASSFNQEVRNFMGQSVHKKQMAEGDITHMLADLLHMNHPRLFCWAMKHDNHGFFIIEDDDANRIWDDGQLLNSVHLLGFCPVH